MKYTFTDKANREYFAKCFKNHVVSATSCLIESADAQKGETCGYIENNRFCIWKNIGIRTLNMLFHETLQGEIEDDGTVTYKFSKRADGNFFTLGFVIIFLIAGIIFGFNMNEWIGAAVMFALSAVFFILRLFHSKNNRERLLFTVEMIVKESNL